MSKTEGTAARTAVAWAADLMFASRIRATAEAGGRQVQLVRSGAALATAARTRPGTLVLLDLEARGLNLAVLMPALRAADAQVIGFVSHVRADLIELARAHGVHRVLARSAFVRELPDLLAGAAAGEA
jgi:CheY-like chemotaxis protein